MHFSCGFLQYYLTSNSFSFITCRGVDQFQQSSRLGIAYEMNSIVKYVVIGIVANAILMAIAILPISLTKLLMEPFARGFDPVILSLLVRKKNLIVEHFRVTLQLLCQ